MSTSVKSSALTRIALIVALGGLLMGFDASVISGVNKFIKLEFELTDFQLGWAVSSLTLVAAVAMLVSGPLSDRYGRRAVLRVASVLYAVSALGSAFAPDFTWLVIFRMIGGLGVGASLILAPMYIAEIAPSEERGRLVSFNQLNIVIGITLAYFTNLLIVDLGDSDLTWVDGLGIKEHNWRWMLGLEAVPAVLYFLCLFMVPRSPRWLLMHGKSDEAKQIFARFFDPARIKEEVSSIVESLDNPETNNSSVKDLFNPALKLVLTIGLVMAVLQQITGINAVFFYAPMIFEQTGIGTDASLIQAVLVGLVNLVFTVVAMIVIDRLGRKPLLIIGVLGITLSMGTLSYSFSQASYTYNEDSFKGIEWEMGTGQPETIRTASFESRSEFREHLKAEVSEATWDKHRADITNHSIVVDGWVVLIAILVFVASFAVSVGPVMWVLFSELFPTMIRGLAIAVVGLVNSLVSFGVQLVFPWELDTLGSTITFALYGAFAFLGLLFIIRVVPETKGRSLEQIEDELVTNKS